MSEHEMHVGGEERSLAERLFWLWVGLAFGIGLAAGGGLFLYQRATSGARYANLSRRADTLTAELSSARAATAKVRSELAAIQAASSPATSTATDGTTPAPGTITTPKAGDIAFVSRTAAPSPAAVGKALKLSVVVAGKATDVYMQVKGGTYSKVWQLHKVAPKTASAPVSWVRTDAIAPKSGGDYQLFAWGFVGKRKFVMAGADSLTVK